MTIDPSLTPKHVAKSKDEVEEFFLGVSRSAAGLEVALRTMEPQISTTQWALLKTLRDDGERRPFDIAQRIGTSRQLILQASRKLEKLGLIEIAPPKNGRKAVNLSISAAGADHLQKVGDFFAKFAGQLNSSRPAMRLEASNRVLKQVPMVLGKSFDVEGTEQDAPLLTK